MTAASLRIHRNVTHPGAESLKRTKYGIPDINEEDAGKCDTLLQIVQQEGSNRKKFKCLWRRENGNECGKVTIGLNDSR